MDTSIITRIGGEDGVRRLVERFYDIVETHPAGANLVRLHFDGHGLGHARVEQFNFLCGFLGGRRHYAEKHGHMNVKRMHEHVVVSEEDAENWLLCMDMAIDDCNITGPVAEKLRKTFRHVALQLVNVPVA